MKTIKKLLLAAGIFFQMSAMLFADAWSDAFLAFGGGSDDAAAAQSVVANANRVGSQGALTVAKKLGTPEAFAIGRFVSQNKKDVFKSIYSDDDVVAAAQEIINEARRSAPVAPVAQRAPVVAPQPAPSRGWADWLSGSAAQNQSAVSEADLQKAMQAQQDADAAAAAASNQALASLVNSGATGLNLYKGYIDLIFNLLQQAVNAIVDPAVQQQVIGYAQNKLAGMKASAAAANRYNSRTLGRMNSKKVAKKSGNKRS